MQWLRWLPAGQIDWSKSVFLQTKVSHFETMMTTVDEVNSDKTKVPDEFIFRSVLLDCFVPHFMRKVIHSRCKLTCKLLNKIIQLLTCMQTNNWVPVFYESVRHSLLLSSEIILKTIIRLRLGEYCRVIPSTSSQGLFNNIHQSPFSE